MKTITIQRPAAGGDGFGAGIFAPFAPPGEQARGAAVGGRIMRAASPPYRDMLLDAIAPGCGMSMSARDARDDFSSGRYLSGVVNAGLAALDLVPAIGAIPGVLRAGKLAKSMRAGHNPKPLDERPFYRDGADGDYQGTPRSHEDGRLAESIEGVKLDAPFVAGRRRLGEGDEGIPAESWHEVASGLADSLGRGNLGKDLGRYTRSAGPDGPVRRITISNKATEDELPRVAMNEAGHATDDLAGEIPRNGLSRE